MTEEIEIYDPFDPEREVVTELKFARKKPRYWQVDTPGGFCLVIDCDEGEEPMVRLYLREENGDLSAEINRMPIQWDGTLH